MFAAFRIIGVMASSVTLFGLLGMGFDYCRFTWGCSQNPIFFTSCGTALGCLVGIGSCLTMQDYYFEKLLDEYEEDEE